jgi:hypothetical protein
MAVKGWKAIAKQWSIFIQNNLLPPANISTIKVPNPLEHQSQVFPL